MNRDDVNKNVESAQTAIRNLAADQHVDEIKSLALSCMAALINQPGRNREVVGALRQITDQAIVSEREW